MSGGFRMYKDGGHVKPPEKGDLVGFVNVLKSRGCYIGEDGHIYNKWGRMNSHLLRNGYYEAKMQINHKYYYYMEHRVVYAWFYGNIPDGLEINHKDYDRGNNKIENLELMTRQENVDYSRENTLRNICRGEQNGKAVLTNELVLKIKDLYKTGLYSQKKIAKMIGRPNYNISRIITGTRYGSVN